SVNQIAPVLVLHQLAEHFSSGLQLAWREMLLPTNYQDHVFDDSIVELLLRRAVDGMRKVDTCDNGADVLLDLLDLHGLGGNPRRGSAHDPAPRFLTRSLWRARGGTPVPLPPLAPAAGEPPLHNIPKTPPRPH